jgi:threonine aldolase
MVERLAEDHHNARVLAEGLVGLPGMQLELDTVQTNLVIFGSQLRQPEGPSFAQVLARAGVKVGDIGGGRCRAVTHYGLSQADIHEAVRIMQRTWGEIAH